MSAPFRSIGLLTLSALLAYGIALSPLNHYLPQIIALTTIIIVTPMFAKVHVLSAPKPYLIYFLTFLICLSVFTTGGLASPVFFLFYFLLFVLAFSYRPAITIAFSLVLIILLGQYLTSPLSIIPLMSLIFITPLAWFVAKQHERTVRQGFILATEETDFLFWLNLKFKTGIIKIIDATSILLSNPRLTTTQKQHLHYVRDSAKNLLNSAKKLTQDIDDNGNDL